MVDDIELRNGTVFAKAMGITLYQSRQRFRLPEYDIILSYISMSIQRRFIVAYLLNIL